MVMMMSYDDYVGDDDGIESLTVFIMMIVHTPTCFADL